MKAHEIIDRLAKLDEAAPVEAPVEEPIVEPEISPQEPTPGRRRSSDPFELPPEFDPGALPRPKAENDDTGAIGDWLEATQQPIQDWDWDGQQLRLLMDDGSTEIYSRNQLEQFGIFDGEMAFAENLHEDESEPVAPQNNEAAGVLDQILGRTSCEPIGEIAPEPQVIEIDGKEAEKLGNAISDVVQTILGIVQGEQSDKQSNNVSDTDAKADKADHEKSYKPKKDSEKSEDKEEDKEAAKEEDKEAAKEDE